MDALDEIAWPTLEEDLRPGDEERRSDGAQLATAFEVHERLKRSKPVRLFTQPNNGVNAQISDGS